MATKNPCAMLTLAVVTAVSVNTAVSAQEVGSPGSRYSRVTVQRDQATSRTANIHDHRSEAQSGKNIHDHRTKTPSGNTARRRVPGRIVIPPGRAPSTNERPKRTEAEKLAAAKMKEIRAPATARSSEVFIDRNITLNPNDVITKRLIFEGSDSTGVTFDFNGATLDGGRRGSVNYGRDMIEVRSEVKVRTRNGIEGRAWKRPENILVKNGKIIGSVRVWGMGKNGEHPDIRDSSKRDVQHVQRVRMNAPRNIVFDGITITGVGRNPFYFSPGVTYSKLINSEVKGKSDAVGIYLDAESAYNTIENSYVHVETKEDRLNLIPTLPSRGWPQMAVDGSSWNTINNNRFASLRNGGIYLYRNCGEKGTIRITPPEHNTITNNFFYYKKYTGHKPAIYLGSRDYGRAKDIVGHCGDDRGRSYGSSRSNEDYARHNIIKNNKLSKRQIANAGPSGFPRSATVEDMIVTKNKSTNSPNDISDNRLVE
jgi:hypothetical protein